MERHRLIQTLFKLNIIGDFKIYCGSNLNLQLNDVHYTGYLNGNIYMVQFLWTT